jgi:hypothetical protein
MPFISGPPTDPGVGKSDVPEERDQTEQDVHNNLNDQGLLSAGGLLQTDNANGSDSCTTEQSEE